MDERVWTDQPLAAGAEIDIPGCRVNRGPAGFQCLVSGDLEAALAALCPGAKMLGFLGEAEAPNYAIRIARDQALLVTAEPVRAGAGWHAGGFAVSPAGGCYACLDLIGPQAGDVLAHGLASAPPIGSPSAAIRFAGVFALVTGTDGGLRLWVEAGHETFLTTFLQRIAAG